MATTTGVDLAKVRNIGIMAHIDAGKTTTTERILFYTGMNYKIGEVHDGAATWTGWSRSRSGASPSPPPRPPATGLERPHTINIIDTPGHVDFTVEVERILRVLDGAVAVFDGVAGVEPQSETVWRQADRYSVPRICFVNKMDRVGAEFLPLRRHDREPAQRDAAVDPAPDRRRVRLQGVIDLVTMKALVWNEEAKLGEMYDVVDIPETHADRSRASTTTSWSRRSPRTTTRSWSCTWRARSPRSSSSTRASAARRSPPSSPRCCAARPSRTRACSRCSTRSSRYLPSPLDVEAIEGHAVGDEEEVLTREAQRGRAVLRAGVQDHERPAPGQAHLRPGLLRRAGVRLERDELDQGAQGAHRQDLPDARQQA